MDRRNFIKTGAVSIGALTLARDVSLFGASNSKMSIIKYSSSPTDAAGIAKEAAVLTRTAVDALGGMGRFVSKGETVCIKPNIAWNRTPEQAATTNPDAVAEVVKMCLEAGASEVKVLDNTCHKAKQCYPKSGIQAAASKAGAEVIMPTTRSFRKTKLPKGQVIKEWEIFTDVLKADKFINMPIAKHHGLSKLTLSMKNLMGCCGGKRNRFHQNMGGVLTDLAQFFKPDLNIMDAIRVMTANGPIGGNLEDVARRDTVIAGVDQVAMDAFGATLFGLDPMEISYVVEGQKRGLGTSDYASLKPVIQTV
jgi:uncharacterized protein (DUF362 family)